MLTVLMACVSSRDTRRGYLICCSSSGTFWAEGAVRVPYNTVPGEGGGRGMPLPSLMPTWKGTTLGWARAPAGRGPAHPSLGRSKSSRRKPCCVPCHVPGIPCLSAHCLSTSSLVSPLPSLQGGHVGLETNPLSAHPLKGGSCECVCSCLCVFIPLLMPGLLCGFTPGPKCSSWCCGHEMVGEIGRAHV